MNKTREDYLRIFHAVFNRPIGSEPTAQEMLLRRTLIEEETKELFVEMDAAIELLREGKQVPHELYVNMLKELADVQTVVSGTSVSLKPLKHLDEAFERVHESNMSKLGADGKPMYREDGKVLKGPGYFPPDLSDLI